MINQANISPQILWDFKDLNKLIDVIACSRSSSATMFENGLLITKATNEIRFEKGNGILCERYAINQCIQSRLITEGVWNASGDTTTSGCFGLDGVSGSCARADEAMVNCFQEFTLPKKYYTLSFYIKSLTTDVDFEYSIDNINFETVTANSEWQRVQLTKNIGNPIVSFNIPNLVMVDGIQLEEGTTATTFIPTTTASVAREADVITIDFKEFNDAREYLKATEGCFVVGANLYEITGTQCLLYGEDSNEYIKILIEKKPTKIDFNVGFNQDYLYNLTSQELQPETPIYNDNIIAANFGQGKQYAVINGVVPELPTTVQSQTVNLTNFDTIYLGCEEGEGSNQMSGYITLFAYYNYKVDNETLSTITTNNTDLFTTLGGGNGIDEFEWNKVISELFCITDPLSQLAFVGANDDDVNIEDFEYFYTTNILNLTNNN